MKKKATSQLPSDDFTWTAGKSFGLDTFLHDMEEGEGVAQAARLPQTKGLADLPPGTLVEESQFSQAPYGPSTFTHGPGGRLASDMSDLGEDRLDGIRGILGADAFDNKYVRLPALEWLELEGPLEKQDPERLPKNPVDLSIKELEEAWGVHRRTDGVSVITANESPFRLTGNSLDLDRARYEASLQESPEGQYRLSSVDLRSLVAEASRRSAAGYPLREIFEHSLQVLGRDAPRAKQAMQAIAAEHGLAGKVFVRASVYPGCHNGEWNDHVKKYCKTARYVVADSKCRDCMHNCKGTCGMFQRRLVAKVPWEEARDIFAPQLQSNGIKVASKGSAKEALRRAFAKQAPERKGETYFPQENLFDVERQENRLRSARIEREFQAAKSIKSKPKDLLKQKAASYLEGLEESGLLTQKQAKAILRQGGTLEEIRSRASALANQNMVRASTHDTGERAAIVGQSWEPRIRSSEVKGMLRWASVEMNEGWAGKELDGLLRMRFSEPMMRVAGDAVQRLRAQHEGLAGHLYVDASVYGEKGIKGCEEGALKHRANAIPYLLKMAKCDRCVFCNQHGKCNKYAKELVSRADFKTSELRDFQREAIRMADASDAEKTASIFAPIENPVSDWELGNENLENFEFFQERTADAMDDLDLTELGLDDGFDL